MLNTLFGFLILFISELSAQDERVSEQVEYYFTTYCSAVSPFLYIHFFSYSSKIEEIEIMRGPAETTSTGGDVSVESSERTYIMCYSEYPLRTIVNIIRATSILQFSNPIHKMPAKNFQWPANIDGVGTRII